MLEVKQVPRGGDAEIKRRQKVRQQTFRGSRGKGSEGKALGQHRLGAKVGLGVPSFSLHRHSSCYLQSSTERCPTSGCFVNKVLF